MLTITVRGPNMEPLHLVDDATSLEWQTKHLGVGGWVMRLPAEGLSADLLRQPDTGITVTNDDGAVILSGPVEVSLPDAPAVGQTIEPDESSLIVTGTDDNGWLADRIVLPPPGEGYDDRSGPAGSVIAGYVDANAGPGAGVRQIAPGITIPVAAVGTPISMSARFQNLMELVAELAMIGGVSVRVEQQGRALALVVAEVADLSDTVLFSVEAGNIAKARVATSVATSTVLYVAGQGVGAARSVVEISQPGVRRRERLMDRRDLATTGALTAAAAVELEKASGSVSLTVDPVADGDAIFGTDYRLGDLVGVEVGSVRTVQRVTEAKYKLTPNGVERALVIGAAPSYGASALLRSQQATRQRLSPLERI